MENTTSARLRLLSYVVIAYMMLAFAWWSVLLFTKNQDAFQAKRDRMQLIMVAEGAVQTQEQFLRSEAYQELERKYKWQEYMILGEAGVFIISLVIGVWLINRSYHKEVTAAQQQRNFLLSITHELKSPLASIRLVLETFQRRELPKEKSERLLRNAIFETERLNTLVNDLLLSARLESAYQPHQEEVNLAQLMEDVVSQMESKYHEGHFSFDKKTPIDTVIGDKAGLASVVLNLLENAVKYSPGIPEIEASIEQMNGFVRMEIADQGIGIAEKDKQQIFDKFYRVGNEDTRKTKGTGLGLYIVKQLVKAHKGTISVLDNEPQGTVFRVDIPMEPKPVSREAVGA